MNPKILRFLPALLILSFVGCLPHNKPIPPKAQAGILDVSSWNFERDGNVPLDGEWNIYWKSFGPFETSQEQIYTTVPGKWTNNSQTPYPNGYATLHLKILVGSNPNSFYLQNGVTRNAFRILVGNETVYESGKIGFDESSEKASINIQSIALPSQKDGVIDLYVQISCYHYHVCGIATPYYIGTRGNINKSYFEAISRDIFILASLGTLALFHFVLFLFWKDEKIHLYFSFVCFLASIRILSIGETRMIYNYLPMGVYEIIIRISGITFILLSISFTRYIQEVYPDQKYRYIYRINYVIALLLSFAIPFTITIYSKVQSFHFILILLGLLTFLFPITHGVMLRKPGAKFFLLSLVTTMLLFSLDILTEFARKGNAYLTQYGFLVFGLSQAIFIADRMIQNFRNREKLKQEKELALAEVKFKSAFLSTMSHEIRTPMNGILGMTQMFGQTNLTDEQKEYLNLIQFSGENLLLLVNDILDLTKLEAGKFELRNETIPLPKFLNDIVQLFRTKISVDDVKIELVFLNEIPSKILTDQRRFTQIMSNLLSNAVKFTEKGKITVTASSKSIDANHSNLTIQVKDTGIGIPNQKLEELFEPFVQIHSHLSEKTTGTGLGLTITRKIVEEMSGTILVASELGVGSTFTIEIPIEHGKEETTSNQESVHHNILKSSEWDKNLATNFPIKILVADDDSINLKVTSMFLKKLGYRAQLAENGARALESVKTETPDLIFLDVQMPDMNGIQVTREIRKNKNLAKQPVIIALTANVMEEEKERCLQSGMDDFMTKPLLLQELVYMIKKWSKGQ
ncbi:ATP-binding protein [Leptospira sp. WS60.C2]